MRLVAENAGTYLTDTIVLPERSATETVRVKVLEREIPVPPKAYVGTSPSAIGVFQQGQASIFDMDGRPLWTTVLPPDVGGGMFGKSVAYWPSSLHTPGSPYDVHIVSAGADKQLKREGRIIVNSEMLEEHLVISSLERGKAVLETEVLDEAGGTQWTFTAQGYSPTCVAVEGDLAIAIYPRRPDSRLAVSDRKAKRCEELVIKGAVLNDVAFIADHSAILVWGSHNTALITPDGKRILWQTVLRSSGKTLPRQLSSAPETRYVALINNTVSTIACEETEQGARQYEVISFDVKTGDIVGCQLLFQAPAGEIIGSVKRLQRGATELLVFPHRVYELASNQEDH